jgi:hypothetical protein
MLPRMPAATECGMTKTSGKPATSTIKAKTSRILATATGGVTDAGKLHSVAIEEGLCRAD